MATSTDFVVLALLSKTALYGQSALLREFQRELRHSVSKPRRINLVSRYAPTLGASPDVKDSFYGALADTVMPMNIDELYVFHSWRFQCTCRKPVDSLASSPRLSWDR